MPLPHCTWHTIFCHVYLFVVIFLRVDSSPFLCLALMDPAILILSIAILFFILLSGTLWSLGDPDLSDSDTTHSDVVFAHFPTQRHSPHPSNDGQFPEPNHMPHNHPDHSHVQSMHQSTTCRGYAQRCHLDFSHACPIETPLPFITRPDCPNRSRTRSLEQPRPQSGQPSQQHRRHSLPPHCDNL